MKIGIRKPSIKKRIAARTSVKRIVRSKIRAPKGFGWITNPKRAAYNRIYYRTTKKACYIATVIYKDNDAWQVERLRQFRDRILMNYIIGIFFVRFYYMLSPRFIVLFRDIKPLSYISRKLLDSIVHKMM